MYATIPEDAEAILSKQAKNQAPGALDEESGGDSQPPRKSYSRIIAATLLLLSFVLVAGAAAGNASGSSSTECPPGTDPGMECIECITAYVGYCETFCSSRRRVPGCGAACSIIDRCCACGN